MKKSEIIGKLYDLTIKLEEEKLTKEEYRKTEVEIFELNQILDSWKKEWEDEE